MLAVKTPATGSPPARLREQATHNRGYQIMAQDLRGDTIAVLGTDGVEQVELTEPMKALKSAGGEVRVIAPKAGTIQGFKHHDKTGRIAVDLTLDKADASNYAALVLPGGVINPDALRLEPKAI